MPCNAAAAGGHDLGHLLGGFAFRGFT